MKTLKDFSFLGQKVLLRCDFNVPLLEEGKLLDSFRIKKSLPTIRYLVEERAKVILISHLGRPRDREEKYSLKPIALVLEKLLGQKIGFLNDCLGVEEKIDQMKDGQVILLENLRFHKGEENNDEDFAKSLVKLADIYINDAFAVCHREHASIVGIAKFLPSGAGLLLEEEIKILGNILENPQKPLIVLIGGEKVKSKIRSIENISRIADSILVNCLIAKEIRRSGFTLQKIKEPFEVELEGEKTMDIGDESIELFKKEIEKSKTIIWVGQFGKTEDKRFQKGSQELAKTIINQNTFSVVGGGDTIEFLNEIGLLDKFNHISTGGGALLVYLSGEKLPGIEALVNYGD